MGNINLISCEVSILPKNGTEIYHWVAFLFLLVIPSSEVF